MEAGVGKLSEASYEQMYAALKRITKYQSVESLHRYASRDYGVDAGEAIEMAYENVIGEAKAGLRKVRNPAAGRAALSRTKEG